MSEAVSKKEEINEEIEEEEEKEESDKKIDKSDKKIEKKVNEILNKKDSDAESDALAKEMVEFLKKGLKDYITDEDLKDFDLRSQFKLLKILTEQLGKNNITKKPKAIDKSKSTADPTAIPPKSKSSDKIKTLAEENNATNFMNDVLNKSSYLNLAKKFRSK